MRMGPWYNAGTTWGSGPSVNSSMFIFLHINGFHLPCQSGSAPLQASLLPEHTEHPFRPPGQRTPTFLHFSNCLHYMNTQRAFLKHTNGKKKKKQYPDTRNEFSSLVIVCAGCSSLHRRAHTIPVVFTNKYGGQLPERCHIVGFKNLALWSTQTSDVIYL